MLQKFGEHKLCNFFGGPCSTQNQMGGPWATARLANANDHLWPTYYANKTALSPH